MDDEQESYYHSADSSIRVPKELFAVICKGKDPQTGRTKTWVRVHTSKVDARKAFVQWQKLNFGDIKLVKTSVDWEGLE